jgi:flagellar hook protein FlgE
MGISSALYSGVSGLNTNSSAMSVIGNNLANTNTLGFKGSRTVFSDLLSSTVTGSGGLSQVGRGVNLSVVDNIFSQGTFDSTESGLDVAIEGDSFFMLREGGDETMYYSRAGAFRFDEDGYLVNPEGFRVQGKYYNELGELIAGDPGDIQVEDIGLVPANATTEMSLNTNLDASAPGLAVNAFDYQNTDTFNYSSSTQVFDTLGNDHLLTTYFVKDDTTENLWHYFWTTEDSNGNVLGSTYGSTGVSLETTPATGTFLSGGTQIGTAGVVTDYGGGGGIVTISGLTDADIATIDDIDLTIDGVALTWPAAGAPTDITTLVTYLEGSDPNITATYTGTGPYDLTITTATAVTANTGRLEFDGTGNLDTTTYADSVSITPAWDNGSIDTPLTLTFDTTQFNSASTVISQEQNGYGSGDLTGIAIDDEGAVVASYSNGQQTKVAHLVLAKFNNPNGLELAGSNLFIATSTSGAPRTGLPGPELGKIFTNSLEQSNVDMGAEFVRMITVQRGFQANSKIITTVDELLGELINLKR